MQRRNFIKTTGIVCTLSSAMGGNAIWNLLSPSSSLQFPQDFNSKGKSHLNELFKDIKKDVDYDSNKDKWVKQMLQPKKILKQKESFGGGYHISFINKLGNTVTITKVKGKNVTKFS